MKNQQNRAAEPIFTPFESDAAQFTPGAFIAVEGETLLIESVEEDESCGYPLFRVNLKKQELPKGAWPIASFFVTGEADVPSA